MFELYLTHGRRDANQEMDDWGFDGPRLQNVTGMHQTYGDTIRIVFADNAARDAAALLTGWEVWDDCQLSMERYDDMIVATGADKLKAFYGDWGLWLKKEEPAK